MLKPEVVRNLKPISVSARPKVAGERLWMAWGCLDKSKRKKVLDLAGIKNQTIQRAYKTGNVTAKVAVSVALAAKIDPDYLIGKSNKQRPYSDELVVQFLTELGYKLDEYSYVNTPWPKPVDKAVGAMRGGKLPGVYKLPWDDGEDILEAYSGARNVAAVQLPKLPDWKLKLDALITELYELTGDGSLDMVSRLKEDYFVSLAKVLHLKSRHCKENNRLMAFFIYLLMTQSE